MTGYRFSAGGGIEIFRFKSPVLGLTTL